MFHLLLFLAFTLLDELLEAFLPQFRRITVLSLLRCGVDNQLFLVIHLHAQCITRVEDLFVVQLLFDKTIKAIFDSVIGPAVHHLGNEGPLAAILIVQLHDHGVFLMRPLVLVKFWVQMEDVAVAALFRISHTKLLCNLNPCLSLCNSL